MRWSFGQPAEREDDDLDRPVEAERGARAPEPVEADAWDSDEGRGFGALIERRFDVVRIPWQVACEAWRSGTDRVDAFAVRLLGAAATGDRVAPRLTPTDVVTPPRVIKGLGDCQKPFHLWNVERIETKVKFELKPVAKLALGRAALLSEEQRPPRKLEKATKALVELVDERDFRILMERQQREQRVRVWLDPLPFGVPDEPEESVRVISLEELMAMRDRGERLEGFGAAGGSEAASTGRSERVPSGRGPASGPEARTRGSTGLGGAPPPRRSPPSSGGISMDQPDDDEPPRRRRPPGGLSLEQPDDDEAPPPRRRGPPGGLSLEQPDDDES